MTVEDTSFHQKTAQPTDRLMTQVYSHDVIRCGYNKTKEAKPKYFFTRPTVEFCVILPCRDVAPCTLYILLARGDH